MTVTVRYFAWLRERVGTESETVASGAGTVRELVEDLKSRDERYALAFADMRAVRVAIDQELADAETPLDGVREVAFFPPMTGG